MFHEVVMKIISKKNLRSSDLWRSCWEALSSVFLFLFPENRFIYMLAMVLAQLMALINAFIFHKFITFRSSVSSRGLFLEFFRFSLSYLLVFFVSLILLPVFVEGFDFSPKLSVALILPISIFLNYFFLSRFAFKYRN